MTPFFSWKSFSNSLIALILVGGAVGMTSANLESQMDIRLYDESYYLTQGLFWPIGSWQPDYSPLYSLYYKALSLAESDPIALYYLNYRVWAVVFGLCIFGVLRAFGASVWLAWIWAITGVCSGLCLPLWPKAGHMAMLCVSILLIAFKRFRRSQFEFLILSTISCFTISWIRPEFFAGGMAGLALIGLCWWRGGLSFYKSCDEQEKTTETPLPELSARLKWVVVVFAISFMLVFLLIWGLPVGRSGRGLVAFGQHFAHNWHNLQGRKSDILFDWVNWRPIMIRIFGSADSVVSALVHNPIAFAQHLWFNLKYLVYNTFTMFSETLFPFRIFRSSIALLVAVLLIVCEWQHRFLGLSNCWRHTLTFLKTNGLYLIPIVVPSLVAGLVFQPRPHYILPLLPFFLAWCAILSKEYQFNNLSNPTKTAIRFSSLVAVFLFMPDTDSFFKLSNESTTTIVKPESHPFFEPITCSRQSNKLLVGWALSDSNLKGKRIFDGSTGVADFLGKEIFTAGKIGFEMDYEQISPIQAFLVREKIQVIILAGTLKYDMFFGKDLYWQQLKSHPQKFGWVKESIPGSTDSLLIRQNELEEI